LANAVVGLDDLLGSSAGGLVERLADARDWATRFALLDRALGDRLDRGPAAAPEVAWAWRQLYRTGGRIPVAELAAGTGWRYRHPAGAIDWLGSAFGLREHFVVRGEDGTVHHAELAWGDGFVMLGAQRDGFPANPGQLYLVVAPDELDAHHERAVAAGAQVV